MKNIVLTNETAQVILNKVDAFKNDRNKLQLQIGVKSLGDGLACQTILVNGGMMSEIGFKTSGIPEDYIEGSSSYFTVNVSACTFISYLKALIPFDANIQLWYDEKSTLYMQVGNAARVSVSTFEEMDALLPCDHRSACAMVKLETKKFLNALKVGSFVATPAPDSRGITDRVVIKFTPEQTVIYSTDTFIMTKAWCESKAQFNKPNRCVAYLNEKLGRLGQTDKAALIAKIEKVMTDPKATVQLAEEEGFEDGPITISLPASSMAVFKTICSGTENLTVVITPDHVVVNAGNVFATFSLAGRASEVFEKSVDPWELTSWTGLAVVDKEGLINSLAIAALSASPASSKKNVAPFHTSFLKDKMIVTDRLNNKVALPLIKSAGDLSKVNIHLDVEKALNVLGKLANGNVVLRYFIAPDGSCKFPVSISNGDIEADGTFSYTYILPVNIKKEEKKEETNTTSETFGSSNEKSESQGAAANEPPQPAPEATSPSEDDIPALDDPGFDDVM